MEISRLDTRLFQYFRSRPVLLAGVVLGLVSLASYAAMIPRLGFYGDDWGYIWLLFQHGSVEPFLRHSRVGFIPIYDSLKFLLGPYPWTWQLFMVFLRWICGFGFWMILRKCWPNQPLRILLAASLFIAYPGYMLQSAAVNMSAFFILLGSFLYSIWFNIRFLENRRGRWIYLAVGLVLAAINLTLAEYFYFMELVRPFVLAAYLYQLNPRSRDLIRKGLPAWLPFLAVFVVTILWRLVAQSDINGFYTLKLLDDIRAAPVPGILNQIRQMGLDIWGAGPQAFFQAILPTRFFETRTTWQWAAYLLIIVVSAGLLWVGIAKRNPPDETRATTPFIWISLGLIWSILSGWSIWLAELRFGSDFTASRFTMPFMPGSVLLVIGLVMLLSIRWRRLELAILLLCVTGSIAFQNLVANEFRRDWAEQKSFFNQLVWRFPDLEPGTMVFLSQNPMRSGEENALSAATNWVYHTAPGLELDYYVYFIPGKYYSDNPDLKPGGKNTKGHLVGQFTASLEKSIVLNFDSRGCIRTLYPEIDNVNGKLSDFIRSQVTVSNPDRVLRSTRRTPENWLGRTYGESEKSGWCWRYQAADLLSRSQDWQGITALSPDLDPAEYNHDEQKLMVFITAWLQTGNSEKAERLLSTIKFSDKVFKQPFCRMIGGWDGLYREDSPFGKTLQTKREAAGCR